MGGRAGRTILLSAGLVWLLLALLSCENPPALFGRAELPPLVVRVEDGLNQQPLEGGNCRLGGREARTDASGRCRFDRWSTEDVLEVEASGYQGENLSLVGLTPVEDLPSEVTVVLFPDRVEGVVMDAYRDRPVVGAEVRTPEQALLSDGVGQFVLSAPQFPVSLTVQAVGYDLWQDSLLSATVQVSLRPNVLEGVVVDQYNGEVITGALVVVSDSPLSATTSSEGRFRLGGVAEQFTLRVEAPGYRTEEIALERTTHYTVVLRPTTLRGIVRDINEGRPISQTRVVWSGGYVHADAEGRFLLQDVPEEARLQFLAPGYARQVLTVTGVPSVSVELTPFAAQGIYVTSYVAGTPDWFGSLLNFVDQTELNAMVIEVKDAWGWVTYDSQVPLVRELGTAQPRYNIAEVLRQCRERGIYTIAYFVTFEDSQLADARPAWAVQNRQTGQPWRDSRGLRWTDPYREEVWEYNLAIARELAALGFDEIQFDYLRFPTDGNLGVVQYAQETSIELQYETITAFLQRAYEELAPTGAFISADVFGYAAWRQMWEQGQDIGRMTHYLDYICPMSYPSHYSRGELGCANPNACPYEIVLETLRRAHLQMTDGQRALLRPWVQDFDLGSPPYGPVEVQAQIRAAADGGAVGWCLWNAGNVYTTGVDYSP